MEKIDVLKDKFFIFHFSFFTFHFYSYLCGPFLEKMRKLLLLTLISNYYGS
jgi:hypothetical protein